MAYDITWPAGTLAGREFYAGDLAVITNGNPAEYEIVEIESISGDTMTLVADPVRIWPAGSRITPLRKARIDQMPSRNSPTSHVTTTTIRFEFDDTEKNLNDAYWPAGTVWPFRTNWVTAVDTGYDRTVYTLDVDTGSVETTDPADVGRITQRAQLTLNGRELLNSFRSFIAQTRGRAVRFWKDSGTHDLEPVGSIGGSTTLDVAPVGYSEWFAVPQDARQSIAITLADGLDPIRRKILAVEKRDGFDRLILDQEIPSLERSAINRISYLMPMRFDQDVFEIEHITDDLRAVRSSVVVRSSDSRGMIGFGTGPRTLAQMNFNSAPPVDEIGNHEILLDGWTDLGLGYDYNGRITSAVALPGSTGSFENFGTAPESDLSAASPTVRSRSNSNLDPLDPPLGVDELTFESFIYVSSDGTLADAGYEFECRVGDPSYDYLRIDFDINFVGATATGDDWAYARVSGNNWDNEAILPSDIENSILNQSWPRDQWIHVAAVVTRTSFRAFIGGVRVIDEPITAMRAAGFSECSFVRMEVNPEKRDGTAKMYQGSTRMFAAALYTDDFTPPTSQFPIV